MWKRFVECLTIYICLALFFSAQAWALSPAELDALVPVIIQAESSGNQAAVGDGGRSRGLMQIQKATWLSMSDYEWDEAFDPDKNVQVGRRVLETINAAYRDTYGVNATKQQVMASYNTGHYYVGQLPECLKKHPNNVYRRVFNE